jgi:hypothetical protein
MRLRWEQIDPHIAVKVGAEIARIRSDEASRTRETEKRTASTMHAAGTYTVPKPEPLAAIWHILALCVALLLVILYMTVFFHMTGPEGTLALTVVPMSILAVGCVSPSTRQRGVQRMRGRIRFDPQLHTLFANAGTTRAEQLYGDLIILLSSEATSSERRRNERLHRELLRQCNTLLADHRRIELHRRRVQSLIEKSESVAAIDAERAALVRRMEDETDPVARHSLAESVELCTERRDSVRALSPMLTRLDAHNEVIYQALSLARAAVTRAQATPVSLATPDVSSLRATVTRVTHETRAVEEVVKEIDLYLR